VQRHHEIDLQAETILFIEDNLPDKWWLYELRHFDGFVDSTSLQIAFLLLFVVDFVQQLPPICFNTV
jgi:hypothetical protein